MLEISTKICFLTDKFFVLFSFYFAIMRVLIYFQKKEICAMNFEENAETVQKKISELDGRFKTALRMIETDLICPNPYHEPKTLTPDDFGALVDDIKTDGLTSPLTVRAIGSLTQPLFQLISDEKQLRACIYAKISPVPCIIVDALPEQLPYLEQISIPRNFFEEADMLYEIFSKNRVSEGEMAKYFGISAEDFRKRLTLHEFDSTERKIVLKAGISLEHVMRLYRLDPRTKCEVYRAMMNGVHGRSAEDLIFNLSESKFQTRIYIKSTGLFYNSIDKAVATMNRSGIPVKCVREDKKTITKLIITVPKHS